MPHQNAQEREREREKQRSRALTLRAALPQVLFRDLPEFERLALMDKYSLSDPQMGLITAMLNNAKVTGAELHACLAELGTELTTRDLAGLLRAPTSDAPPPSTRGRGHVAPDDASAVARLVALGVTHEDAVAALKSTGWHEGRAANLLFDRMGRSDPRGAGPAPEPELNLRGGGQSSDESSDDDSSEEETESLAAMLSRPREIPLPKGIVEADAGGVFDLDDPSPLDEKASSSAYASGGGDYLD